MKAQITKEFQSFLQYAQQRESQDYTFLSAFASQLGSTSKDMQKMLIDLKKQGKISNQQYISILQSIQKIQESSQKIQQYKTTSFQSEPTVPSYTQQQTERSYSIISEYLGEISGIYTILAYKRNVELETKIISNTLASQLDDLISVAEEIGDTKLIEEAKTVKRSAASTGTRSIELGEKGTKLAEEINKAAERSNLDPIKKQELAALAGQISAQTTKLEEVLASSLLVKPGEATKVAGTGYINVGINVGNDVKIFVVNLDLINVPDTEITNYKLSQDAKNIILDLKNGSTMAIPLDGTTAADITSQLEKAIAKAIRT